MRKACLIIVFNHRYDKNIPVLRKMYSGRFSHIFFLVPFYDGADPDVIPVYESSYYFQSFFAQGFHRFFRPDFTHYVFAGDDCLLNPAIDENNLLDVTGIPDGADFIPEFIELHSLKDGGWWHTKKAIDFFHNRGGAEVQRELPSREEALRRFNAHGLTIKPLTRENIFGNKKISFLNPLQSWMYKQFFLQVKWKKYRKDGLIELPYPVAGSYSDMFVVTKDSISDFCRYCGILAAVGLFVELAIPTALVLSSKRIVQEKDLRLKGLAVWTPAEVETIENKFNRSLKDLLAKFPEGQLYYHPVKLSKWTNDL
ncbi:MAG: hypothetical protein H7Y42_18545 [Chitinophagaceae bacterium]|nr:hypothetical protein [Chitinophagaceae bacterium]